MSVYIYMSEDKPVETTTTTTTKTTKKKRRSRKKKTTKKVAEPVVEPEPEPEPVVEVEPVLEVVPEPTNLVSLESVANPGKYLDAREDGKCTLSTDSSHLWRKKVVDGYVAFEFVKTGGHLDAGYYDPYVSNKPASGPYRMWILTEMDDGTVTLGSVVHRGRHLSSGSNGRPWTSNVRRNNSTKLHWKML